MKEQTAVEWLLKAQFELIFDKGMSKRQYLAKRVRIEKQAKQMEKEQIEKAIDEASNAYGIIKMIINKYEKAY